ncbi:MAG: hypothetical protein BGO78_06780 [Chloroflexi bacterium 44-23]|nr:MAG: hypothetical protein BGO78_06780 [Chloroflexi bacterium 44-23]
MTIKQILKGIHQTAELKTRLVFFDMDHTILNASKYHRQSFTKSLNKLFGTNELPRTTTSGYPYLEVARRYANACGISDEFYDSKQAELTSLLVENMLNSLPDEMSDCVYPGTVALLERLRQANIALGITTGTMRDIAVPLLERTGLLPYFPLMAFGDQVREREQILQKALDQAPWVYGLNPDEVQLVTVGDAVTDITAGKAYGAVTIAVANGVTSMEQLAACKPDFLFANLEDTNAIYTAILNGTACN